MFEFKKIYVKNAQNYGRWLTKINYTYVKPNKENNESKTKAEIRKCDR